MYFIVPPPPKKKILGHGPPMAHKSLIWKYREITFSTILVYSYRYIQEMIIPELRVLLYNKCRNKKQYWIMFIEQYRTVRSSKVKISKNVIRMIH